MTTTADSRKGIRQPQALNWSSGSVLKIANAPVASSEPADGPTCGQLP